MPLYRYKCRNCEHEFEYLKLRSSDEEPDICPECGHDDVKQRLSKPYIKFNGSGFHVNDYPSDSS